MSSSTSSRHTPTTSGLHPTLDAALGGLDVRLEEELARYRRHRLHQHVAPSPATTAAPSTETAEKTPVSQNNDIVDLTQTTHKPTPQPEHSADRNSQDYLQSSEALLKTLDQSPKPATPASNRPQLTGWYIGTAALLIIAAALVGVSWRPSWAPIAQQPKPSTPPASSPQSAPSGTVPSGSKPLNIEGPNLAETGSGTPQTADAPPAPPTNSTTAEPKPSPQKSPTLAGREPDFFSAILPPQTKPEGNTASRRPLPEPANVAAPPPASDRRYFVLMDYTAEGDIELARLVIGEAYYRRFDDEIKIQMGVFDNPVTAQALVNELKTQGITAKINQPNSQ
ncbi:MAG: hypothetical protein F6J87_14510 [Spirulina sp. SIO3F2]|nr:hypothetical protein [Spirulina sp. SIO3F2]